MADILRPGQQPARIFGIPDAPDFLRAILITPDEVVAGGGTDLQPAAAALVLTGLTPSVVIGTVVQPAVATLVLTGLTPSAVVGTVVAPSVAALTLTGATPSAVVGTVIAPTTAQLTLTGATPSSVVGTVVSPTVVALVLNGQTPPLDLSVEPSIGTLTLSVATATIDVSANVVVTPTAAAFTLTGIGPDVIATGGLPAPESGGVTWTPPRRRLTVSPRLAVMTLRGRSPHVLVTHHIVLVPAVVALAMVGGQPTLTIDSRMRDAEREREEEVMLLGIGALVEV